MAKKLGYGGLANTNGARDFTSKVSAGGSNIPQLVKATSNVVIVAGNQTKG